LQQYCKNIHIMKNTIYSLILVFVIAGFTSCKKDDDNKKKDTTAPVIEKVLINGKTDSDHIHLHPGDELELEIHFSDDEELKSAKVEIHHAGDGHSHRMNAVPFAYNSILELSGKQAHEHLDIHIPDNAADGEYHLTVQAIDASGNESVLYFAELEVETH